MNFAVVLGNAVLVTQGEYDAELAGISRDTLKQHTLATITHYAASNRLVNPRGRGDGSCSGSRPSSRTSSPPAAPLGRPRRDDPRQPHDDRDRAVALRGRP
ncbi:hypothetical protein NKG05_09730 [Oerskovia sp. M15]